MARRYDSSRRKKSAEKTRARILAAALKLHREGITEYGPLAKEADCSLPTVRRYFPTKEALYRGCTRAFAETVSMPDLASLRGTRQPTQRLVKGVVELCRIHEAMLGYAWLGARLREGSPTLDAEMSAYEGLIGAVAEIITADNPQKAAVVRGLVDFLTYRALRTSAGLSPEDARAALLETLRSLLADSNSFVPSDSKAKTGEA